MTESYTPDGFAETQGTDHEQQYHPLGASAVQESVELSPDPNVLPGDSGHTVAEAGPEDAHAAMQSAAIESLRSVVIRGQDARPDDVARAVARKTILPEGPVGDVAAQVASIYSRNSEGRVPADQVKWFALGLATQATAMDTLEKAGHIPPAVRVDPDTQRDTYRAASLEALRAVVVRGQDARPDDVVRAIRKGTILPEGPVGEVAATIAATYARRGGDRLSADQTKWFALGLATQATASSRLESLAAHK